MAKTKPTPAQPSEPVDLKAQLDQVLDLLVEQQDEIARLKSAQTGIAAKTVDKQDKTAEMDAELDALAEEFKDYPAITVFARRAVEGVEASVDIRLKGEAPLSEDATGATRYWHLHWFNFDKEGRAHQAMAEGYLKVERAELQDAESVTGIVATDQYVRRGTRGTEVLHKIPRKLYTYKKKRDMLRRQGVLTSESQLRSYLANNVAAQASKTGDDADEAGTFIMGEKGSRNRGIDLTITQGQKESLTV